MSAKVRGAALALLGRRDYTTAELRQRLIDREHPPADVDAVVAALVEDRTIDDRRVAAAHVRVSSQIKGRGRLRIRQELAARGIDRHLADELIADLPPDDEAAAIAKFLSRKRFPAKPTAEEGRKIFQQLLRKGFTSEAISKAVRASRK